MLQTNKQTGSLKKDIGTVPLDKPYQDYNMAS